MLRHKRRLGGHRAYITALRLEDHSLLVVATQSAPMSAIADYAKRWGIETLFGIYKRRGFCCDYLRNILLNLEQKTDEFLEVLRFLSSI